LFIDTFLVPNKIRLVVQTEKGEREETIRRENNVVVHMLYLSKQLLKGAAVLFFLLSLTIPKEKRVCIPRIIIIN
jgi:hypothetical protein